MKKENLLNQILNNFFNLECLTIKQIIKIIKNVSEN